MQEHVKISQGMNNSNSTATPTNATISEIYKLKQANLNAALGDLIYDSHHTIANIIDEAGTPFIIEWFVAFLQSEKFTQLSAYQKMNSLFAYEELLKFWSKIDDAAYKTNTGMYETDCPLFN